MVAHSNWLEVTTYVAAKTGCSVRRNHDLILRGVLVRFLSYHDVVIENSTHIPYSHYFSSSDWGGEGSRTHRIPLTKFSAIRGLDQRTSWRG